MTQAEVTREQVGASGENWRVVFHKDEVVQRVRPKPFDGYLRNPHRGTTTFQRFNGDPLYPGLEWNDKEGPVAFSSFRGDPRHLHNPRYPDTTLSYCRWLWSVIEPRKGQIRWDILDGSLRAAAARGQMLQMRIQPYIGDDLPAWFWEMGGKVDPQGDAKRREPDHNHASYLKHWGDLIRAVGKRYDGHPALESFDIAYGGPCGEVGGNATPKTAGRLVDVYLRSFRKTQLISMLGTPGCRHASHLPHIGWRADCYGDVHQDGRGQIPDHLCWNHMLDAYPKELFDCGVQDTWKTAPVTWETCWTVGYWASKGWDIDWILEEGLRYHPSVFMPKSSFIPEEWREKVDAFDRRLGYRFVLRHLLLPLEAKPGQTMSCAMYLTNVGVAPLYRPYVPALRFRQGKTDHVVSLKMDVRRWLPGIVYETAAWRFPAGLKRGVAAVALGIVDAATKAPRVLFGNEGYGEDGWLALTFMDVR
jgi:hypothetical protein